VLRQNDNVPHLYHVDKNENEYVHQTLLDLILLQLDHQSIEQYNIVILVQQVHKIEENLLQTTLDMAGKIAHITDDRVGIEFGSTGIDSASHLKRLVALNSSSPKLLDREMSNLIDDNED